MPPVVVKLKSGKTFLSYILTAPHPHEHVMVVKCEELLNELSVKVYLLIEHQTF